jgi:hypothetical protein
MRVAFLAALLAVGWRSDARGAQSAAANSSRAEIESLIEKVGKTAPH